MGRDHFYTIDPNGDGCSSLGYRDEGVIGYVFRAKPTGASSSDDTHRRFRELDWSGLIPIYGFYNDTRVDHFYCQDSNGEDRAWNGWVKQGETAWWMYGEQVAKTIPLFRWWSHPDSDHFYTTDPSGGSAPAIGYQSQGILGYIYTEEQPGTVALRQYCWDY